MTPTQGMGGRLRERLRALGYGSPLYALTLKGRIPEGLNAAPEPVWPGDPAIGNALFQGRFTFAGHDVALPNEAPWGHAPPSGAWAAELHGFDWLRHFHACAVTTASRHARELVRSWIAEAGDWHPVAWRPDVLGRRLLSWLCHAGFLLEGADEAFREAFLTSLAEQSRHLARSASQAPDGAPRLGAAIALAASGACLEQDARHLDRGLRLIERELTRQILGDGGHVSRDPSVQLALLGDLVVLRDCLAAAGHEAPPPLAEAIGRMAPMLRFLRHGDGGLALFNGSGEASAALIDVTLARAGIGGRPLAEAPDSGYERLSARRSTLICDAGGPPPHPFDGGAHAGTLSFEFSVARERLIVNCGAGGGRDGDWERAMRNSAAHSTLVVDDTNSCEILGNGHLGRRPREIGCSQRSADGNLWLELSHDGYAPDFGVVHRRRFYLDAAGEDLRGEDSLVRTGPERGAAPAFALRFHLHPEVRASRVQTEAAALLRLPGGAGWRFQAEGGELAIEESVYLGRGAARRSEQVVVRGRLDRDLSAVKWRLSRVAPGI